MRDWGFAPLLRPRGLRPADSHWLTRLGTSVGSSVINKEQSAPTQRVMEGITRFITNKLKLKVNETKSAVARPQERKFLGFSFSAGPEVKRIIAPKALER